jgi:hypothetical protein
MNYARHLESVSGAELCLFTRLNINNWNNRHQTQLRRQTCTSISKYLSQRK